MTKTQQAIAAGEKPAIVAVNAEGRHVDQQVLEDLGVAYDPTSAHLDLTKDEKRRTTALMMAIQAYNSLIIKDAEMYIAVSRDPNGPTIKPATMNAMVEAAIEFDLFISGAYAHTEAEGTSQIAEPGEAPALDCSNTKT